MYMFAHELYSCPYVYVRASVFAYLSVFAWNCVGRGEWDEVEIQPIENRIQPIGFKLKKYFAVI